MRGLLKFSGLVWSLALFLLAAAPALRSSDFMPCSDPCAADENGAAQAGCPAAHAACDSHCHSLVAIAEAPEFSAPLPAEASISHADLLPNPGPVDEIDYPPQLS